MFALGAIGDALGAPLEMMTATEIAKQYGRLTTFVERGDHKFGPIAKGETTDDTQLKLAIARSIVHMLGIDLGDIAREHVAELPRTTRGWGGSTREAVKRLEAGAHWSVSGSAPCRTQKKRGKGNGVAMKIDPVGAFCALRGVDPLLSGEHRTEIKSLALMTHNSAMGVASGLAQVVAIHHLLGNSIVLPQSFAERVTHAALIGERVFPAAVINDDDFLSERFQLLGGVTPETSNELLRSNFGNGGCYVYESLPVAYALFLRKPHSIEALYDAVAFGGDTDTVASIVGSLLGALNGSMLIPQALWSMINRRQEIETTVAEFVQALTP
ncbi:MAG: hypothetical protein A3C13_02115 [Candidatus Lloydbacteria bacterium RIFCSPHIGHO2_02_FULL_50_11]|nr:MAG: hypothetical protein A3C13_02115 [Candidatus Lloydbacteria bacterium RIFCSPHIGHO2_02_FULL_50_11]